VTDILCQLATLYLFALLVRIVLSWFPITPGSFLATVFSFLYTITEPVLGPVRRMIPPIGMGIDISPIVVLIGIRVLMGVFLRC
jgi:YggT family protein